MIPSYYFNASKPRTQRIPSISKQQRDLGLTAELKELCHAPGFVASPEAFYSADGGPLFFCKDFLLDQMCLVVSLKECLQRWNNLNVMYSPLCSFEE